MKDIPKLHIEGGVDDGVDSAVDVTQPRDHADQRRPDVTWRAQHLSYMDHEEGSPARKKNTWEEKVKKLNGQYKTTEPQ